MQPAFEILQWSTAYLMMYAGVKGRHICPAASLYKSNVMTKLSLQHVNTHRLYKELWPIFITEMKYK
jgi:hypothetical protein